MKVKGRFFFGLMLGALLGGALTFFCLPFDVRDSSFLTGFIACTSLMLCAVIPLLLLHRESVSINQAGNSSATQTPVASSYRLLSYRTLVFLFFILAGLLVVGLLFKQDIKNSESQQMQRIQLARQTEVIETTRNSGLVKWMSQVLQQAETELNQHPQRMLKDETIAMIAALSYSFKPYFRFEGDSVLLKELSPERGMLLLALCQMNIDSGSLKKIFLQSHFAHADLTAADLGSAYLSEVNLFGAQLKDANLNDANLKGANLSFANLWGARLRTANMNNADLKRADLSWADLNNAVLKNADLTEADLISAKMSKVDLQRSVLKWTNLTGAILNEANLTDADMFRTNLTRAQLLKANLTNANMTLAQLIETNLAEANLTGVELSQAVVPDQHWLTNLSNWLVGGALEIQTKYEVSDESSKAQTLYQLKKVNE